MNEDNKSYKDTTREHLQNALNENAEHAKKSPGDLIPYNKVAYIMDYFDKVAQYSNATDNDIYEAAQKCLCMWDSCDSELVGCINAIVKRLENELRTQQLQNLPPPHSQPSEPTVTLSHSQVDSQVEHIQKVLENTLWNLSDDSERIHISLNNFESFTQSDATLCEIKQFADLVLREFRSRKNFSDCNPEWQAICKEMEALWDKVHRRTLTKWGSFVQPIDGDAIPSAASDSEIESTEHFSVSNQSCSTSTKAKATNSPKKKMSKGDQCRKVMGIIIERLKKSKERDELGSKLQKRPSGRDIGELAKCDYRTILGTSKKPSHLRSIVNTAFDLVDGYKVDNAIRLLECMKTHIQDNGELADEGWRILTNLRT